MNVRLKEIVESVNKVVHRSVQQESVSKFLNSHLYRPYQTIRQNDIIPKLNNLGRRPEQVFFSWMRGHVFTNYFIKALGIIFVVDPSQIAVIGDDDLKTPETFKKTPKADLEIPMKTGRRLRVEVQCGFTGTNDIKQHKVLEAKRIFREEGIHSMAVHFDIFNGQVAFIPIDQIQDNDINWITRQQMEGQTVFNIDQNFFTWKLTQAPRQYDEMDFGDARWPD